MFSSSTLHISALCPLITPNYLRVAKNRTW
jgi:hypothetical protein